MLRERTVTFDGSSDVWTEGPGGLVVPAYLYDAPQRRRYELPIGVDLFAGAGGFSLGVHQAGFHVAAALELDFNAATTYAVNLGSKGMKFHFDTPERAAKFDDHLSDHLGIKPKKGRKKDQVKMSGAGLMAGDGWISHYGCPPDDCKDGTHGIHEGIGWDGKHSDYLAEINRRPTHPFGCEHLWVADVRSIKGEDILAALDLRQGEVDFVFGGPPCQGFSISGKRNVVDPRNSLVFEFVRLVLEIRPKAMAMENVPGMVSMTTPEGVPVVDALCRILADGGFGGYEALRKSICSTAGVGAALNGTKSTKDMRGRKTKASEDLDDDQDPDEDDEQLAVEQLELVPS